MQAEPVLRPLERHEVGAVWSIDRSERIERIYEVRGRELVLVPERYDVQGWPPGEAEQYGPILLDCFDRGGCFEGAFDGGRLIGVSVLDNRFIGAGRDLLQLEFLHVGRSWRGRGLGRTLFRRAASRARSLGARGLYVSATPSEHTVRFYLDLGCRLADAPDPELFTREPEDVHLHYEIPPDA